MTTPKGFRPSLPRGYTVVELMMALAIFAIGATGVLAMQIIASHTNAHAKNIAVATQLARSWQDNLTMDALLWGGPELWPLGGNTRWVQEVGTQGGQWFLPTANAGGTFGPGADALGNFATDTDVVFCAHLRLIRLLDTPNAELVRTEVRVFWPKGEVAWQDGDPYCDAGAAPDDIGAATDQFHFVYHTSAVRQTPSF
jgi:prepilin-type N-terminal cleavage/methylation domain-containing protein